VRAYSSTDDSDGLDLDEPFRQRERSDTDQRACRRLSAWEKRRSRFADYVSLLRGIVHHICRDLHDVREGGAGGRESEADIAHRLHSLHRKIACSDQRAGIVDGHLARDVDRSCSRSDDCLRE
jgi:hypothetical protein